MMEEEKKQVDIICIFQRYTQKTCHQKLCNRFSKKNYFIHVNKTYCDDTLNTELILQLSGKL